jgi:hypothetical protein
LGVVIPIAAHGIALFHEHIFPLSHMPVEILHQKGGLALKKSAKIVSAGVKMLCIYSFAFP